VTDVLDIVFYVDKEYNVSGTGSVSFFMWGEKLETLKSEVF